MKHLSLLVLVVSFLFSMISMPGYAENKEEGMRLFDEAEKLRESSNTSAEMKVVMEKYEKALTLFEKADYKEGVKDTLGSLGAIYSDRFEYEKAADFYQKSLLLLQEINDPSGQALILFKLAKAYKGLAQNDKAVDCFEKAIIISRKIKNVGIEANSLMDLGAVYMSLGQYEKSLNCFEKSLIISRAIKDMNLESGSLNNLGAVYSNLGQYEKAAGYLEKSLAIAREVKDLGGEAAGLQNLGLLYMSHGQVDRALDCFERSLDFCRQMGNNQGEATSLNHLGIIYSDLGQSDRALECYEKSLDISRRIKNVSGEADSIAQIGNIYRDRGQYAKAIDYYLNSLSIYQANKETRSEAVTYLNLGTVHAHLHQYEKAENYFQKSLSINREIKNISGEADSLGSLGNIYFFWGRSDEAVRCYEKTLAINQHLNSPLREAQFLNNLGTVCWSSGQYAKALDYFNKSLIINRQLKHRKGEAGATYNLGNVYENWGKYDQALECYLESLSIQQRVNDPMGEAYSLNALGNNSKALGQYNKAVEYYEKSLAIHRQLRNPDGEARALYNVATLYLERGDYDIALANFEKVLELQKNIGAPLKGIVDAIGNLYIDKGDLDKAAPFVEEGDSGPTLGRYYLLKSDYREAKKYYDLGQQSAESNRDADYLFTAYTGLGLVHEGVGDDANAERYFRKAIELTEEIRSGLLPEERENFFDVRISGFRRTDPYDGLARVLLKMKKKPEAFRTSEYTKARLFAESMSRRSDNSSFDIPSEVLEKDRELSDRLAALKKKRQESYEKSDQEVISAIEPQVKTLEENLQTHIKTLRDKYPLFAATKYPEPIDLNQSALKENEWVLEYHVTDTGILIYLTKGKDMVKALFKPLPLAELDKLIVRFSQPLEIVSKRDKFEEKLKSFDLATGKKLFDLLLGDVLDLLPIGASVIIVPDGALGILPFEMFVMNDAGTIKTDKTLPYVSGAEFFGDRNPISYSQSVTALTLTRIHSKKKPSDGGLLVLADPVFVENDKRTAKDTKTEPQSGVLASLYKSLMAGDESEQMGGLQFQRLSRTGELAEALAAMYKKNSAVYTGFAASKSNFFDNISPSLNKFNEVVFATHGYFGKDLPGIMEPVLVLTLVPPGIDGYLRMTEVMGLNMNADIVALTACQTGLGKQISGEGTMGMGRAFQYAGARSVLMSLWSVHEVASMNLIKSFFRNMKEGKNKSDALASARSEIRQNGFDHPFFWAGFILVGEPQ